MLNLQTLKIEPFTEHLASGYEATFGTLHPEYVDFLRMASSLSLSRTSLTVICSTTMSIIRLWLRWWVWKSSEASTSYEGRVSAEDALNYLLALLCHDIGYVKGACERDEGDNFEVGEDELLGTF